MPVRIAQARARQRWPSCRAAGPVRQVTISVGATLAHSDDTEETLLERADRLMYESKSAGKNRVTADA